MDERTHVSVYFYPIDGQVLEHRPEHVAPSTWMIDLARKHVAGQLALPGVFPVPAKGGKKTTVSLPDHLHAQLSRRYPDHPVHEVLRSLALAAAGRPFPLGADEDELGLIVPIEVPESSRYQDGPELDALIARVIRRARSPKAPSRLVNAVIPGELVPSLDRVRRDTPAARFLGDALIVADQVERTEAVQRELETSAPRFHVLDPRPLEPIVRRLTTPRSRQTEARVIRTALNADLVRDLLLSVNDAAVEATLLVRTTGDDKGQRGAAYPAELSALVFQLCWQHDLPFDVHLAHVVLDGNELWTYVRFVPGATRHRVRRTALTTKP